MKLRDNAHSLDDIRRIEQKIKWILDLLVKKNELQILSVDAVCYLYRSRLPGALEDSFRPFVIQKFEFSLPTQIELLAMDGTQLEKIKTDIEWKYGRASIVKKAIDTMVKIKDFVSNALEIYDARTGLYLLFLGVPEVQELIRTKREKLCAAIWAFAKNPTTKTEVRNSYRYSLVYVETTYYEFTSLIKKLEQMVSEIPEEIEQIVKKLETPELGWLETNQEKLKQILSKLDLGSSKDDLDALAKKPANEKEVAHRLFKKLAPICHESRLPSESRLTEPEKQLLHELYSFVTHLKGANVSSDQKVALCPFQWIQDNLSTLRPILNKLGVPPLIVRDIEVLRKGDIETARKSENGLAGYCGFAALAENTQLTKGQKELVQQFYSHLMSAGNDLTKVDAQK